MTMPGLLKAIVAAPGLVFAILAVGWLLGWQPRERTMKRLTGALYVIEALLVALLFGATRISGIHEVTAPVIDWFAIGDYHFPLILYVDQLSLPLIAISVLLCGLIGSFSARYMHREKGYHRFFLLLHLFSFGVLLLFSAGSFDLIIGGWELVGLTSVLLIGFFQERTEPVNSAIFVFANYRASDIGLLVGVVVIHLAGGHGSFVNLFNGAWPDQSLKTVSSGAGLIAGLLLLAACGKASQVPFVGWLPRAMEGPTPSSAVFYGALSVHAGAYLLLRAQPFFEAAPWVQTAVVVIGLLTALQGTMAGRAAVAAKNGLALASMTQLGIIFMEIGLGFTWLPLIHICSHATLRTLQFLRAPSMLHDYHNLHKASGGYPVRNGEVYKVLLPLSVQAWFYRLSLDRGHFDAILERFAVAPMLAVARILARWERRFSEAPAERPAALALLTKNSAKGIDV